MKDFSAHFPILDQYTYLNTASCGLISKQLVEWRNKHDINLMEGGSLFRDLHKAHITQIRRDTASFFGTKESNVALVPNFSFGLNTLIDGMSQGLNVLLIERDYPSVNWPFEQRDFNVSYVQMNEQLEANISEAFQKHPPDIFAFSMVQYVSGLLIDIDFLSDLKRKYPQTLFITDGTQFLGTSQFNFDESPLDIIGASAYKWLISGYGNGFFLIKEEAQQKIHPKTIGFNSADAQFSKKNDIEFVGHLEPGHQDTLNYGSLGESLKFLNELGMDKISNHLEKLTISAKNEFTKLGLLDPMIVNRKNQSTIFNIKGDASLFEKLKLDGIIGSLRGDGMRVSFHFYNTENDLQKLLSVLK
ncbi:MAG: aminotransferase class V-fold PLP-dependent enzyme [Flavobacteriaceae bacterium]|nr:aminotransferase class V-fold PLP-dependent enzyme [Flavobacteriaceae bacterium]